MKTYISLEQLYELLDKKESFILAIDGKCTSGKSTIAKEIAERYHANLFHMDDFYLPNSMRSEERLKEIGGNVNYEMVEETILKPISRKETVMYQPFNHAIMDKGDVITPIPYCPFNIIEGSYALRKELAKYYTDIVMMDIDDSTQLQRLHMRNPKLLQRFITEWIPKENAYFEAYELYDKYPILK